MKRSTQSATAVVIVFGVSLLTSVSAFALGFKNPDQDAAATGQGEAFVAQADTPGAVYYNPAGLTQIHGTEVSGGGFITFRDIRFKGSAASEELNDPAYTAHFYLSTDLGQEKWRFGFGLNFPYGNEVDWGNNSSFKYQVTKSSLQVANYQPTLAYKFNDHVSLGVGLNIYDGRTELNRLVPFSIIISPFLPDGRFRFDGNAQALGGTAGLLVTIDEHNSIGLTYRSPFAMDFHGHAVVKDDPTGSLGRSPASAQIDFPQTIAAGYALRPNKKLKLEVDVEWTNWETLNQVKLHSPNAAFATDPNSTIPFSWKDGFFYEFGAQYLIDDHWVARAGYIFSENTVPNDTFSPTLADSNRHVFSVGLGYSAKRFGVDLVYQYSLSTDRTVSGSADTNFDGAGDLDGKWKSDGHALMATSTVKF
jgi:long-chain fatty acid transport protein